jgi:uroporphyrinogen decarboxylase
VLDDYLERRMSLNSREKVRRILNLKGDARTAFWTGNPWDSTAQGYMDRLGLKDREELLQHFHDDCRWFPTEWNCYKHPEGKSLWDPLGGKERTSLAQPGCLADATTVAEVEAIPWPNIDYMDFTEALATIRAHKDKMVFTGTWSCYFHLACDYFGMEEYFIKMHTHPAVVEALTERFVDFYLEANKRLFEVLGDDADVFFFGNDFGTQLDLLISPEDFRKFVLPGFKKLIDLAHKYGKKAMLHSCGSIVKVIPWMLEAGMDGLHPLQALAGGMDAPNLAQFRGKMVFMGGVDTQQLLVHGTPQQVRDDVRRLRDLWGEHFIVSPSHEAILPNVPLENVLAMAEAARE